MTQSLQPKRSLPRLKLQEQIRSAQSTQTRDRKERFQIFIYLHVKLTKQYLHFTIYPFEMPNGGRFQHEKGRSRITHAILWGCECKSPLTRASISCFKTLYISSRSLVSADVWPLSTVCIVCASVCQFTLAHGDGTNIPT
jgi:hypothetical protein